MSETENVKDEVIHILNVVLASIEKSHLEDAKISLDLAIDLIKNNLKNM